MEQNLQGIWGMIKNTLHKKAACLSCAFNIVILGVEPRWNPRRGKMEQIWLYALGGIPCSKKNLRHVWWKRSMNIVVLKNGRFEKRVDQKKIETREGVNR